MKLSLHGLLTALLFIGTAISASAESVSIEVSGSYFYGDTDTGEAYVWSINSSFENYVVPETVTDKNGNTYIVTSLKKAHKNITSIFLPPTVHTISGSAFRDCIKLTSINLENVKVIEYDAFRNCESLTTVDLSNVKTIGENAFEYCENLQNVDLSSLESLGDYAFYDCTNLGEEITFPKSIKKIPRYAFSNCTSLKKVNFSESIVTIDEGAFKNTGIESILIPDNIQCIWSYAFEGCASATYVYLGKGITGWGITPFKDCTSLETVVARCETIISSCFQNDVSISSVTFSEDVKSVGETAFSGCNLTALVISDGIETIKAGAFANNKNLKMVTIGKSLTSSVSAFSGCSVETVYIKNPVATHWVWNPASVKEIILSDDVKTISSSAFEDFEALTSIHIPSSVETIGFEAFRGCANLETVEFEEGLESIEGYAFYWCRALKSPNLPSTLREIGDRAFGQTTFEKFIVPDNCTIIGTYPFEDVGLKVLSIPAFEKCKMGIGASDTLIVRSEEPFAIESYQLNTRSILQVPSKAAVKKYKDTKPWSYFKTIVPTPVEHKLSCSITYDENIGTTLEQTGFTTEQKALKIKCAIKNEDTKAYEDDITFTVLRREKPTDEWTVMNTVVQEFTLAADDSKDIDQDFENLEEGYYYAFKVEYNSMNQPVEIGTTKEVFIGDLPHQLEGEIRMQDVEDGETYNNEGIRIYYPTTNEMKVGFMVRNKDGYPYQGDVQVTLYRLNDEGQKEKVNTVNVPFDLAAYENKGEYAELGAFEMKTIYCVEVTYKSLQEEVTCCSLPTFRITTERGYTLTGAVALDGSIVSTYKEAVEPYVRFSIIADSHDTKEYNSKFMAKLYQKTNEETEEWTVVDEATRDIVLPPMKKVFADMEFNCLEAGYTYKIEGYYYSFGDPVLLGTSMEFRAIPKAVPGDANGDDTTNAADIVEVVNAIMGNPSDGFNKDAADVNGDGVVNAADIVQIVNIIMGTK